MSTHPNAMLILALTPDNTARKTYREILADQGIEPGGSLVIGGEKYHHHGVMEDDYNESDQLSLPEGTIYVFDLVTYGYGEKVTWNALEKQKNELLAWGEAIATKHQCKAEIFVGANYW